MYRVSIDIGGTFTDLVAMDDSGDLLNIKVPTTPSNPERGVLDAFELFLKDHDPKQVRLITHATTITTNALLGQASLELPKTALVTTKGFRDVLEIGRQRRPELYNLFFQRPRPLVPRRYRYEVDERTGSSGEETLSAPAAAGAATSRSSIIPDLPVCPAQKRSIVSGRVSMSG